MTSVVPEARSAVVARGTVRRLLVTRRDPSSGAYSAVGFLSRQDGRYRFAYLRSFYEDSQFEPLPGLLADDEVHESVRLLPVFAERVMSPRRPDLPSVMDALGLNVDAEPFEVLARSGGQRVGDTIELVPVPDAGEDGSLTVDFFVHGIRHMPKSSQDRINQLRELDALRLVPEPDNSVEARALLVTDLDDVQLGYVPTPLLGLMHDLTDPAAWVLRTNPARVGFHFRLLVRVSGLLPVGSQPFAGPSWETMSR